MVLRVLYLISLHLLNLLMLLGRSSACDVVLRSAAISKRHCRIRIGPDGVTVEDLGSANGTCVNEEPVHQSRLWTGDRLRLADCEFLVRRAEPGSA